MKTPYQRMKAILEDVNFIVPVPQYSFYQHGNDVYVECPERGNNYDVIDAVQNRYGGNWLLGIWKNTIDGDVVYQENPHQNGRGLWVWKFVKA